MGFRASWKQGVQGLTQGGRGFMEQCSGLNDARVFGASGSGPPLQVFRASRGEVREFRVSGNRRSVDGVRRVPGELRMGHVCMSCSQPAVGEEGRRAHFLCGSFHPQYGSWLLRHALRRTNANGQRKPAGGNRFGQDRVAFQFHS